MDRSLMRLSPPVGLRALLSCIAMLLTLALAGCAAPQRTVDAVSPATGDALPATSVVAAATPVSSHRSSTGVPRIDASCRVDADCVVKDVGNCCGAYPACVNANSPTDPAAVQAACKASGKMAACGFRQIEACSCDSGTCRAVTTPVGGWTDGPQPEPVR